MVTKTLIGYEVSKGTIEAGKLNNANAIDYDNIKLYVLSDVEGGTGLKTVEYKVKNIDKNKPILKFQVPALVELEIDINKYGKGTVSSVQYIQKLEPIELQG